MKFPTTERLVPDVAFSSAERDKLRLQAKELVEDAIAQYETYTRVHQRRISRWQWKPVKKREHLVVYRERKRSRRQQQQQQQDQQNQQIDYEDELLNELALLEPPLTPSTVRSTMSPFPTYAQGFMPTSSAGSGFSADEWKLPTLLMVGSIVGSLNDVMYGVATFDAPSMLLKTTYTHDELLDGEILHRICGPTPEDPFQFVGVKWIVKGNPSGIKSLVRPRDLVFLEATGVETRWNGDRYGYHLMYSLEDLPGCGPLKRKSVLRGKIQSCMIYKELSNGTVDVYMKANFEPNGSVRASIAMESAANGLSYCWKSAVCAQNKKLAWMLAQSNGKLDTTAEPRSATTTSGSRRQCCGVCRKNAKLFRSLLTCEMCQGPMCRDCKVTKKLSCVGTTWRKEITQRKVGLCKSCLTKTIKSDTFEVARDEVLSGKWELESDMSGLITPMPSSRRTSSQEERKQSEKRNSEPPAFDRTLKLSLAHMDSEEDTASSYAESFPISHQLWASSYDSEADGIGAEAEEEDQEYYFDEQGRASEVPRSSTASSIARQSSFVRGVSDTAAGAESRFSTRRSNFVDVMSAEYSITDSFTEYPSRPSSSASSSSRSSSRSYSSQRQRPVTLLVEPLVSQPQQPPEPQQEQQQQQLAELEEARRLSHQQTLWQQITQLSEAAEHVYQITKHNSEVHAVQSTQVWPSVR
ncbi:hypothetical protein Gpo141_00000818 [Globisporangium polare]